MAHFIHHLIWEPSLANPRGVSGDGGGGGREGWRGKGSGEGGGRDDGVEFGDGGGGRSGTYFVRGDLSCLRVWSRIVVMIMHDGARG